MRPAAWPALLQQLAEARDLDVDDRRHVFLAEPVEQDDLVEPVEEFGAKMRAHDFHYLWLDQIGRAHV